MYKTNPVGYPLLVSQRNTLTYLLFNKENRLCGWRNHETGEVKSYYPYFDPDNTTSTPLAESTYSRPRYWS